MHSVTSSFLCIFFFSFFIASSGQEACGTVSYGCGSHGKCHLDTRNCGDNCTERCICDTGFDGNDCTIRVDICPDSVNADGDRTCLHGGKCQQITEDEWSCDCTNAKKRDKMYSGHQCEFAAQVSCEIGVLDSAYAFCTNGGACQTKVKSGEAFSACICDDAFEGRHCQYEKGTRPAQETIYGIPSSPEKESISGGAIFGIIAVSLIVCVGGAVFYMRKKGTFKSNISIPNDLDMKPEPNIKEGVVEANSDFI